MQSFFLMIFESYDQPLEKKNWTHIISTRKNFRPTTYPQEKNFDPQNTQKKNFWTHKISTRKILDPQNINEEKFFKPQHTHKKKFWTYKIPTKAWCHNGTTCARPMMAHNPQNLAHLFLTNIKQIFTCILTRSAWHK